MADDLSIQAFKPTLETVGKDRHDQSDVDRTVR